MTKKIFLVAVLCLSVFTAFSITKLQKIEYSENISYAASEISRIFENYEIKEGNMIGEIDVKLAIKQIMELGYFTSMDFELNNDTGVLFFKIKSNPFVSGYKIKYIGDKLIEEPVLESLIEVKKNMPLNLKEYKNSLINIQTAYKSKGYQFINLSSNILIDGESFTMQATSVNNKMSQDGELVFVVEELPLWDIVLEGEISALDKIALKKKLGFSFRKDYEDAFFLFRPQAKETYPTLEKLQALYSALVQTGYFGEETSVDFAAAKNEKSGANAINIVIGGKLRQIVDHDIQVKNIKFSGNQSLEIFKLHDTVKKNMTIEDSVSNLELLKSLDALRELYKSEGYLFVEIDVSYDQNNSELTYIITEKCYGEINITKEATSQTKDYLLNSFVKIGKGDKITQKSLQDTYYGFMGTGFFKNVDIVPVSMDETTVSFKISPYENDKPSKMIFNFNWTSPENKPFYFGFSGGTELKWANLFGAGHTVSVKGQVTPLSEYYEGSFGYNVMKLNQTNLDMGIEMGALYTPKGKYEDTINATVSVQTGVKLSPSYNISDFSYITNYLSYDHYMMKDSQVTIDRGSGSLGYSYIRLDSPSRPYNGEYLSIAGFGGFDLNDFSKSYYGGGIEGKLFKSLYKFTFGARAKVGHVIDNGGLYSYSVGGMSTVRGYDFGERKGDSTLLFNAELAFELIKQPLPIDFFIFYDIGNADNNYSKLMNNTISSAGIGAKITVPMLGQIRFEYLYKMNENKWVGSFGFGPVF